MIKAFHSGAEVERLVVTGMIVSGTYLQRISKIYNPSYFQIDYARTIAKWCVEHYKIYATAPQVHIEDIFNSRRREFQDGQGEMAQEFLRQISKDYEERESFNSEYLYEKTRTYFHKRALMMLADQIEGCVTEDKIGEAHKSIKNFKLGSTDVSPWINPFSDGFIAEAFANLDSNRLMQLPGKIGELTGPFERGWLVGWLGPMKRGKTFWLFESAFQAAMQKLNVVIASLEMNKTTNAMRIYRRMTALPDKPGEYDYPVFDCMNNQDGTCTIRERFNFNDTPLFDRDDRTKPKYTRTMDYRVCTWCRGNTAYTYENNPYIPETWYQSSVIEKSLNIDDVRRCKRQFVSQFGTRIRLRPYPAFSATINDLEADLEILEFTEGFIPDVIVIDYADILIPPDKRLIERSALDSIWKGLKGMAEKRNCLIITASQSNRGAIRKADVDQTDVAEDIRKIAHVDAMFGLNQKRSEREDMVLRVNVLAHRHRAFSDYRQATVLNQLDLGLPCIDSEIITRRLED